MNSIFARYLVIFFRWPVIVGLLLIGAASCNPAQAQQIVPIETIHGEAGQSIDQFARQIRKRIGRLSGRKQAEVCGAIYLRNGVYGVDLGYTRQDLACAMDRTDGFTGQTIHTHPTYSHGLFSDNDYAAGPGYLVVNGELHHQSGRGTERRVR